ncbi:thioredoxin [Cerasicoccus arenae]|uniref:Thioredoxin n=1 Tax=Cerasicoccus arenae TaxID=424488 RepID=A0A8J3DA24_9BACT|nr:thioredoxin [Cerasicoccus arenae]MBK1857290.1 thioredoxin [Cerasicoccus arenae]GHC00490.1 thioredoxin [Cerasicoccus arenae]
MSALTIVTKDTYATEVEQASQLVVIDFFSPWCMPCKAMEPVLDEIAAERADQVKIVKVDASAEPDLAAKFGIRGAPTFVALRNGEKVDMLIGAKPKQAMLDWIDSADL